MTEARIDATGIYNWTRLRDEVAPAFRRDFPGIIIDIDEQVLASTIPDPDWRGGRLTMIGVDPLTARFVTQALPMIDHRAEHTIRDITGDEAARLATHRAGLVRVDR